MQEGRLDTSEFLKLPSRREGLGVGFTTMKIFDTLREKAWHAIKRKAVEVIVAILTAAIAAITTTSCMGYGPL